MDAKVLSTEGKELRSVELSDAVFGREVSDGAIYHAVRNELANGRVGQREEQDAERSSRQSS